MVDAKRKIELAVSCFCKLLQERYTEKLMKEYASVYGMDPQGNNLERGFNDKTSDMIRVEAYYVMQEWESGGIKSLITNSNAIIGNQSVDATKVAENFVEAYESLKTQMAENTANNLKNPLTEEQIKLADKLVYGSSDLDLGSINYNDFNSCIETLDMLYADTNDGGCYDSVRSLWDGRIEQYLGR